MAPGTAGEALNHIKGGLLLWGIKTPTWCQLCGIQEIVSQVLFGKPTRVSALEVVFVFLIDLELSELPYIRLWYASILSIRRKMLSISREKV